MLVRACTISLALAPARSLLLTTHFPLRPASASTAGVTMSAAGVCEQLFFLNVNMDLFVPVGCGVS